MSFVEMPPFQVIAPGPVYLFVLVKPSKILKDPPSGSLRADNGDLKSFNTRGVWDLTQTETVKRAVREIEVTDVNIRGTIEMIGSSGHA
jgi:hypothetical protein